MTFLKIISILCILIGYGILVYIDWRIAIAIFFLTIGEFLDHEIRK